MSAQATRRVVATMEAGLAAVVVQLVLAEAPGVEGCVWNLDKGFITYAYPT